MSDQSAQPQILLDAERLLQEGRAALMAGDTFAARNAFREATEHNPQFAEAWIGLSSSVPILAEKEQYLTQALNLIPGHPEAEAALRYVRQLQSEGLRIAPSQVLTKQSYTTESALDLGQPAEPEAPITSPQTEFCYIHADRETGLHCIQCDRPICGACAKLTPVGQLCPECRKERRPANYKVSTGQLLRATLTALAISMLISALLTIIPNFGIFLNLILGWLAGQAIVRAVDRVTRLKRGPAIQISVGVATVVGFILGTALAFAIGLLTSPEVQDVIAQLPITSIVPTLFMQIFTDIWLLLTTAIATVVAVRGLR